MTAAPVILAGSWWYAEYGDNAPNAKILGMAAGVVSAFLLSWAFQRRSEDESSIDASRRRLIQAEGDLERALRNDVVAAHGVVIHGEVHGDVVLRPSRQEDKDLKPDEEGPRAVSAARSGVTQHLALAELWAATHARLELYHKIATGQAKQSFRNAQAAMAVGFALLIAFVFVALQASTTVGSVVAGGLGAVSAALAGFVSKTFVRSQEAAASHLRSYFDQPLELSRFLAAERLIADSTLDDEQRAEILMTLVEAMVAGTPQPAAGAQGDPAQGGR
ncbi:TRADD-N-associated membrane domain-containing protein [Streptomyces sp. NPDC002346]